MKVYRIKSSGKFYKNQDSWSDNEDDGQLYTNLNNATKVIRVTLGYWQNRPVNDNRPWEQKSREMWGNAKVISYDLVATND